MKVLRNIVSRKLRKVTAWLCLFVFTNLCHFVSAVNKTIFNLNGWMDWPTSMKYKLVISTIVKTVPSPGSTGTVQLKHRSRAIRINAMKLKCAWISLLHNPNFNGPQTLDNVSSIHFLNQQQILDVLQMHKE